MWPIVGIRSEAGARSNLMLKPPIALDDLTCAEEKYDSVQFGENRKQHFELYAELEKTKEVEACSKILKKARTLLKPLERKAANKSVQQK